MNKDEILDRCVEEYMSMNLPRTETITDVELSEEEWNTLYELAEEKGVSFETVINEALCYCLANYKLEEIKTEADRAAALTSSSLIDRLVAKHMGEIHEG